MASQTFRLGSRVRYPIQVLKLLKQPGDEVKRGEFLFQYSFKWKRTIEGVGGERVESDETTIAELNQTFMGVEGPTDVLAFPIDDEEVGVGRSPDGSTSGPDRDPLADVPLLLGDVVVCPAVAARNAPTHAGTYDDEIALLVVHGILHVLGWDHADDDETREMQAREREHLAREERSEQ
jgi:rRNA maturation RNase YbeY